MGGFLANAASPSRCDSRFSFWTIRMGRFKIKRKKEEPLTREGLQRRIQQYTALHRMLGTTTPGSVSDAILDFCFEISPGETPFYVPVTPVPPSKHADCFANVREHVNNTGGRIIYGHMVWEAPGLFLVTNEHAIWHAPSGTVHDLTPQPDGETSILFLKDRKVTEPVEGEVSKLANYKALIEDRDLEEFIEIQKRMDRDRSLYKVREGITNQLEEMKVQTISLRRIIEKYRKANT